MMVGNDLIDIRQLPASAQKVEGQDVLLTAHAEPVLKAARLQERLTAKDGSTGSKPDDRDPQAASLIRLRKMRMCHHLAERIKPLLSTNQDSGGDQAQRRRRVKQVCRA